MGLICLKGTYVTPEHVPYAVYFEQDGTNGEAVLSDVSGTIASAYKFNESERFTYMSDRASDVSLIIQQALKKFAAKNAGVVAYNDEQARESVNKDVTVIKSMDSKRVLKLVVGDSLRLSASDVSAKPVVSSYVSMFKAADIQVSGGSVRVRSLESIRHSRDISHIEKRDYRVIVDPAEAESIFCTLDNYDGEIAYDTETTGLKINFLGKIGSPFQMPKDIRIDRLCGIIFCNELEKSYYFPCFSREYRTLYSDLSDPVTESLHNTVKARYTVGDLRNVDSDYATFIRNQDILPPDVLLMERVRGILEYNPKAAERSGKPVFKNRKLIAHNGAFEWKCGMLYDIDTRITDDTILMHRLFYRFGNAGVFRSDLKTLSRTMLNFEQLELSDFFPDYSDSDEGRVKLESKVGKKKGKKKGGKIDFSYMDLDSSRAYAPADGDCTLALYRIFKHDMGTKFQSQQHVYKIEMAAMPAVAYCEFYGHRIDEAKIASTELMYKKDATLLEGKFREILSLSGSTEHTAYIDCLSEALANMRYDMENDAGKRADRDYIKTSSLLAQAIDADKGDAFNSALIGFNVTVCRVSDERLSALVAAIEESPNQLNMNAPVQIAGAFYDRLQIPETDKGRSVAKAVLKTLMEYKNADGAIKYPEVKVYKDWKDTVTLLDKFFDNLQDFMYPGGYVFSSFGQITAATGRMGCSKPNCQQYPKTISKIVVPRDGFVMIDSDFAQIEYRVTAALSHEPGLLESFKDPDNDYHTKQASVMFGVPYAAVTPQMRGEAKAFNFGIPFGMGNRSLAVRLLGRSDRQAVELAKAKRAQYFKDQPHVEQFFDQVKEFAEVNGYTHTDFGRRRYYDFKGVDPSKSEAARASALRQAGNQTIQGCLFFDARIITKEHGYEHIGNLAGKAVTVWDGNRWSKACVAESGLKEEYKLTLYGGMEIRCSANHKFLVVSRSGNSRWVPVSEMPKQAWLYMSDEVADWHADLRFPKVADSMSHNARNLSIADIEDDYERGILTGHIAGIKDRIPDFIWRSKESLRDYLRARFDSDGAVLPTNVVLTFGRRHEREEFARDVQHALYLFGIHSRLNFCADRINVVVCKKHVAAFRDKIGFIKSAKQAKLRNFVYPPASKIFGHDVAKVRSVEKTGRFVPMYDVVNSETERFMANGMVTHNSAADIFKIALGRCFDFIRRHNLFGKLLITNMVHDEILFECDTRCLDVLKVVAVIGERMQFHLDNYPPLFIGAGVGMAWGSAKGKQSEIHPVLLDRLTAEAKERPLFGCAMNPKEWADWFSDRVTEFRFDKVVDYLKNPANFGQPIHPEIGNLIRLQYESRIDKEGIDFKSDTADTEIALRCVDYLSEKYSLGLNRANYTAVGVTFDEEEDTGYEDGEEEDGSDVVESDFQIIDTTNFKGISPSAIIQEWGYALLPVERVCGIDLVRLKSPDKREEVFNWLLRDHECDRNDEGAMELVFHVGAGELRHTGVFVRGFGSGAELEDVLGKAAM